MGDSIIAKCVSCGYSSGILPTGGGIRSFRTHDAQPVHCETCRAVTTANVKKVPLSCLACRSVEVTRLQGPGPTICPKCGKTDLRFQDGGIRWD